MEPETFMRRVILVLGMHRSGTSALTGAIVQVGVAAPLTLLPATRDNERGYWESLKFSYLHDELLASAGSTWDDWRPFDKEWYSSLQSDDFRARAKSLLNEEFGEAEFFAFKDPRICRILPFWSATLAEMHIAPHIIITVRSPLEVARSLAARDGFSLEKALLIWLRHVIDAERETRDLPRAIVAMDDFLHDWRGSIQKIGWLLGIEWPRFDNATAATVDIFLSRDLKHQNSPDGALPPAFTWTIKAYDAMLVLRDNPQSRLALSVLDEVGSSFELACALMGPVFSEIEARAMRVEREADALRSERDELIAARNDRTKLAGTQAQRNVALEPGVECRLMNLKAESFHLRRRLENVQVRLASIAAEA